ncbi:MAG: protein BatD [Deltaproteobacteria bacterium]|nr:protein BatD [Deltaproteobacteria bacterium]
MKPRCFRVSVVSLAFLFSGSASAATLALRSERNAVQVGEQFEVEFEISRDANEPLDRVRAPDFRQGFDLIGSPSTSSGYKIQMGMGPTLNVHTQTHTYSLRARTPGVHTIGPATARVSGQPIRSNILTIRVGQPPAGGAMSGGMGGVDAPTFDRQLFMRTVASKTDVFVGEAITVEWQLFINVTTGITEQPGFPQMPVASDFLVDEIRVPPDRTSSQRIVEGHRFNVHIVKRQILVPLKPGDLTIGAMTVDTAVSLGFFRAKKISRSSRPVTITVRPLPADGRPSGFVEANVGRLKFDAEWRDPALKVAANTPLVLRVSLSGEGAARQIDIPAPAQTASFRVFPKVVEDNSGTRDSIAFRKVVDFSIVPTHGGLIALPSVSFHWFDPNARRYQSVTTPPRTIEVEGGPAAAAPRSAPAPSAPAPAPAAPVVDPMNALRPIHTEPIAPEGEAVFASPSVLLAVASGPPAVYLVVLIALATLRRRAARAHVTAQRGAARAAERALARLARGTDRPAEVCAAVLRVVNEFVHHRADLSPVALTRAELEQALMDLGAAAASAAKLSRVIEVCESARFAPGSVSADVVATTVQLALSAIADLAREVRQP